MASNKKVGVTVTAKDQASRDLKKVAKEFANTADAAGKANSDIETPVTRSTSFIGRLQNAIGMAKNEAADIVPMRQFGGVVGKLGPAAAVAGTAITATAAAITILVTAGTAAAHGIKEFSANTAKAVNEQRLFAARGATSIETLTRFGYAVQSVGGDMEDAQDALSELGQRAVNMPADFERWGVATRNTNGTLKTTQELLFAVADRMQQTGSATERLAMADELMSDNGRRLLPILEQGSAGIQEFYEQADEMGATVDAASAAVAQNLVVAMREADTTVDALTRTVGTAFQPSVTKAFESVQSVAERVLERITENDEAFTNFATGSVALLAKGFALLVDTGSALSHVAEGITSVFTFRLGPAFDEARALAATVSDEARSLAGELQRGAEITRDEVVPSVQSETAARANLVQNLKKEKGERANIREAAEAAIGDMIELQRTARDLGGAPADGAKIIADNITALEKKLRGLQGTLKKTEVNASLLAQAKMGGDEETVQRLEAETAARKQSLRVQIAATRSALKASIEAAVEEDKVETERQNKEAARIAAGRVRDAERARARLEVTKQNLDAEGQLLAEHRAAQVAEAARQYDQQAQQIQSAFTSAGYAITGSLRAGFEGIADGTKDAGDVATSTLGAVANAALNAAISYGVQQSAIAATNALLTTQGATVAGNTAAQVSGAGTAAAAQTTGSAVATGAAKVSAASQITAAAAKAGAEAFAAYAGIPFVGPAMGAAASAAAVGTTMGFMGMLAFNKGGMVPGAGNTDSVPAMLTPGEIVLPKEVSQALLGAGAMTQQQRPQLVAQMLLPTRQTDFDRMYRDTVAPFGDRGGY